MEKCIMDDKNQKQILKISDEAAYYKENISGWIDRHGRFFGKDENMARWSGCTHILCPDCGEPTEKGYTVCHNCREKNAIKRYGAKERKKWNGETPLYSDSFDKYFLCEDDLSDFMEDCRCNAKSLRLVICEPVYLREVDEDHFYNELSEDGKLPEAVANALKELNEVIREQDPVSWIPGKYAADLGIDGKRSFHQRLYDSWISLF